MGGQPGPRPPLWARVGAPPFVSQNPTGFRGHAGVPDSLQKRNTPGSSVLLLNLTSTFNESCDYTAFGVGTQGRGSSPCPRLAVLTALALASLGSPLLGLVLLGLPGVGSGGGPSPLSTWPWVPGLSAHLTGRRMRAERWPQGS